MRLVAPQAEAEVADPVLQKRIEELAVKPDAFVVVQNGGNRIAAAPLMAEKREAEGRAFG